jgi:ABC-type polysaccharide/polyol phosphate transport system ATPase subunit
MNDVAIKIENLGKRYTIGARQEKYHTLRDTLTEFFTHPFRRHRRGLHGGLRSQSEDFWALKDVSLEIKSGEVVGIIGRNGAGKTTLLKILSRITEPTVGRAEIRGRVGSLLEVGTGFHAELTGRENIYLNGAILGMKKAEIERKFDDIVAFSEVEKFLDTPVKRYSSGMYVRLAFGVAANLEPDILLVDEVLAVGDAAFQKKCLGKMGEVSKEGRTVLFVSHNMGAVRSLCQKAILLEGGTVVASGEVEATIEEYQKKFVGSLDSESQDHSKRPRGDCTGRVLIKGASITIPSRWRDPFTITFQYEVIECVDRFSIEWLVRDFYGAPVMSGLSALAEEQWFVPTESKAGEIRSTVNEWRLPGGRYSLCAYISNPLIECMDYVEDLVIFDVPDMVPGKPGFIFSVTKYGWLLPEVVWEADDNTIIEQH